jgi:hypothetical protein
MAKTFEEYVRGGRLQKAFDVAVKNSAIEASRLGLRRQPKTPAVEPPATEAAPIPSKVRSLGR